MQGYFGAKRQPKHEGKLKRGRGTSKQPVFGIYKRGGKVYTEMVPNTQKHTLQAIIRGKVSLGSVINSDTWAGYNGLVDYGYKKQGCLINGIESFWSFAQRRLQKFNGVKTNFELHL